MNFPEKQFEIWMTKMVRLVSSSRLNKSVLILEISLVCCRKVGDALGRSERPPPLAAVPGPGPHRSSCCFWAARPQGCPLHASLIRLFRELLCLPPSLPVWEYWNPIEELLFPFPLPENAFVFLAEIHFRRHFSYNWEGLKRQFYSFFVSSECKIVTQIF